MDTEKYKSVIVPIDVYQELKNRANNEGRTISGLFRLVWQNYQKNVKDKAG
tara:strand:- start:227 stop:379 length:153 start_codon:yes stop_codon:yes gene_type:complete